MEDYLGRKLTSLQIRKHGIRQKAVLDLMKKHKIASFLDIGSGDGSFIKKALKLKQIKKVTGIEKDPSSYKKSNELLAQEISLGLVELKNNSIFDVSKRFLQQHPVDVVIMIEVIEHIEKKLIAKLNTIIFKSIRPPRVFITTPNASFRLTKEKLKSIGHEFEWNIDECKKWGNNISKKYGYSFKHSVIKTKLFVRGSHLCVFELKDSK